MRAPRACATSARGCRFTRARIRSHSTQPKRSSWARSSSCGRGARRAIFCRSFVLRRLAGPTLLCTYGIFRRLGSVRARRGMRTVLRLLASDVALNAYLAYGCFLFLGNLYTGGWTRAAIGSRSSHRRCSASGGMGRTRSPCVTSVASRYSLPPASSCTARLRNPSDFAGWELTYYTPRPARAVSRTVRRVRTADATPRGRRDDRSRNAARRLRICDGRSARSAGLAHGRARR